MSERANTFAGTVVLALSLFCCCGGVLQWSNCNEEQAAEEKAAADTARFNEAMNSLEDARKSKDWRKGRKAFDTVMELKPGAEIGSNVVWMNEAELADVQKATKQAYEQGDWGATAANAKRVLELAPGDEEATRMLEEANTEINEARFLANEEKLETALANGDEALKKVDCRSDDYAGNLGKMKAIWLSIRETPERSKHRRDAEKLTRRLERCRQRVKKVAEERICKLSAEARQLFTDKMDTTFLNEGMDVRMRLSGKCKTHIRLKWVLWNRASAHQFANGGFLDGAKSVGFSKVTFSDGYNESYIYDDLELSNTHPDVALANVLRTHEMDESLELGED